MWSVQIVLAALSVGWTAGRTSPMHVQLEPALSCGAVCAYVALRLEGVSLTATAFRHTSRTAETQDASGRMSVATLCSLLRSHGVPAQAVRFRARRVDDPPLPCILLLSLNRENRKTPSRFVGHYVVLLARNADGRIVILDPDRPPTSRPTRVVGAKWLHGQWTGEAIVFGRWARLLAAARVVSRIILVGSVVVGIASLIALARRRTYLRTMLVLLVAGWSLGCSGQNATRVASDPKSPPLVFETPLIDAGLVKPGTPQRFEFPFRVWQKQTVVIKKAISSCGCFVAASDQLLGKPLAPSSRHTLTLVLHPRPSVPSKLVFCRLITDPPWATAIAVGVQYRCASGPVPNVRELILDGAPGKPVEGNIVFVCRRLRTDPPVRLDKNRCGGDWLRIQDVTVKTVESESRPGRPHSEILETTSVRLVCTRSMSEGLHRGVFRFVWSDGTQQEIPTLLRVHGELEPALTHVFAGFLHPSQRWEVRIPLRVSDPRALDGLRTSTSSNRVKVTLSPRDRLLRVVLTAPTRPGRFHEKVILRYGPDCMRERQIEISGVVRVTP